MMCYRSSYTDYRYPEPSMPACLEDLQWCASACDGTLAKKTPALLRAYTHARSIIAPPVAACDDDDA